MPVQKLKDYLEERHIRYSAIQHSRAYTAQEIAAAAHVPGKEMAKTVVVKIDGDLVLAVLPAGAAPKAGSTRSYSISVLSSPAHLVSGGDARLAVDVPPGNLDRARVLVNGEDVTDAFWVVPGTTMLEGVVDDLAVGARDRSVIGRRRVAVEEEDQPATGRPPPGKATTDCCTSARLWIAPWDRPSDLSVTVLRPEALRHR